MPHSLGSTPLPRSGMACIATLLLILAATACDGGQDPSVASRVVISPSTTAVAMGASIELTAQILDQRGEALTAPVVWSSQDLDIATVDGNGVVTGVTPGDVPIVARHEAVSGQAMVTVTDVAPPEISFLTPAEGDTLAGTVNVLVSASDNHGVEAVTLWLDGEALDSVRSPPWELSWNTRAEANGAHAVRVVARDPSGNEGTSFTRSVHVLNPPIEFSVWQPLPPLPIAVRSAAVATDGARVYVAGGSTSSGRTAAVQILDLATETWSAGPDLPLPVDWATATWAEGQLHVLGGVTGGGMSDQHLVLGNGSWAPSVPLPAPIGGTASATHSGTIFIFAGNSGGTPAHTEKTYAFDVALGSWSEAASVPGARINWSGSATSDVVYLIGGGTPGLDTSADLLAYDPDADDWTSLPSIPLAREAHGTGVIGGLVCGVGGRRAASGNFGPPFDDVSCYEPAGGLWWPAPPLPRALQEVNVVSLGDAIIAVGGADGSATPVRDVSLLRVAPPAGGFTPR